MKLFFTQGKLFYIEYSLRLFFFLLRRPKGIINANDLDTLLASHLAGVIRGIPVVYDSHEYFTEVPELIGRKLSQRIWLRMEKWLFPAVLAAYTVNHSLAEIYSTLYNRKVEVIRNLPIMSPGLEPDKIPNLLIYQGALNVGRGIELMIAAMAYLPEYSLWIVGKGDIEADLQRVADASPAVDRILFKGFVPMENLSEFTRKATLGFSLEEDKGKNYHYASPNKVYDYIQASVPVLVSDLPEMRRLVEEYKVGEVLGREERTPERLARKIQAMMADSSRYEDYVSRCRIAASDLNWGKEKEKLVEIYQKVEEKIKI